MDFDLSADQQALGEAASALLERHCNADRLRARVGDGVVIGTLPGSGASGAEPDVRAGDGREPDAPQGFDTDLWAAMVAQGWPAVELAEADGGLGLGMVETAVLCEQVGRFVAPAPFIHSALALGALAGGAGGDDQVARWVARLAAGEAVGTVAWSTRAEVTATQGSSGSWTLSGVPDPVVYGPSADVVVVPADGGLFAVAIEGGGGDGGAGDGPGAARPVPEPAMDRTREIGWLRLADTPAHRLGGPGAVQRLVDRAATALSAELLGVAGRVLDLSVAYATDRVQFGKPIGSFQAIKHKLADALVDVEGMRSTAYYAAWCVGAAEPPGDGAAEGADEASVAASMAKSWCSDAARRVMAAGLQVHGGIGFTWEHELHLYVKRAQLDEVAFGDAAWHRDRLATLLRRRVVAGRDLF